MSDPRPGPETEQRLARREGERRAAEAEATPSLQVDLERLFASHRPQLLALCRRLVGSTAAAEELVQDTLAVAWTKLPELQAERRFRPWIFGIARNLARNARRKRTEWLTDDGVLTPTCAEHSVLRTLQRAEREAVLARALASLDPSDAEVVHLRYVEGMAVRDIDGLLGLTGSGARGVLQRTKRTLRARILDALHALGHGPSLLHSEEG